MNALDIAILLVLTLLLAKGLWLGLIHELCALAGLGVGTVVAVRYHVALAGMLPEWGWLAGGPARTICFAVLLLATLLFFALLGIVLSRFAKLVFLGGFNRVLGGLFGLLQGVLLLALVLYGLSLTDWFKATRQNSRLAPPFVAFGEQLISGGRQLLR